MKLYYKGPYHSNPKTLPHREHIPGAVQFKEPSDAKKSGILANILSLVLIMILAIPVIIRCMPYIRDSIWQFVFGCMAPMLLIFPHELLHAICFKEDVYLYTNFSSGLVFVTGTETMSKLRFIIMTLFPNIILGLIPYIIGMLYPNLIFFSVSGAFAIASGTGDYLNVFNAMMQMPGNARTYLYEFHSYWYLP